MTAMAIGWRSHDEATRRLWWVALGLFAASLPTLWLAGIDPRQFNGISVWVKPWKFMVSAALHLATLALFAAWLPAAERAGRGWRRVSALAIGTALFEVVYITWRASRGEASHFNLSTPLAGLMYSLMGIGAVLLTATAGWLGWRLWRQRGSDLLQTGIALGLLLGWVLGTVSGGFIGAQTGHWVGGTPSDAGGLPVVGWSRDGGDLRVAHFFGLHAMQVVPFFAWAAVRMLAPAAARGALWAFAGGWTALTVYGFVQAVAGRPFPW